MFSFDMYAPVYRLLHTLNSHVMKTSDTLSMCSVFIEINPKYGYGVCGYLRHDVM